MKKKKLLNRLLAIKSDRYNSEFHTNYQRQKRNSPLIKSHKELPKLKDTNKTTILLPINFHKSLNSLNSTRKYNNLNFFQNDSPYLETERIYYPKIFQNNFYIKDKFSPFKKKIPMNNKNILSMKYLELFQEPKENDYIYLNHLIQNEDYFFENEIIEKITDNNLKKNILEQIRINNDKDNVIMENFVRKTINKNQNEFLFIEKIPDDIIDNYAENIYKEIINNNFKENKERDLNKIENENENEENLNQKNNAKLIIHNIFIEFALKNTKKKIELRNQYNKEISIKYISQLICNEIIKLKLTIIKLKKQINKRNKLFATIETAKNKLLLNQNNFNNISNDFYPLTERSNYNYNNSPANIYKPININKSLNLRYKKKDNEKNELNNYNYNNNDNMYITGIKKEYPILFKRDRIINSVNNTMTNNINFQNIQHRNYNNNIKTFNNKFIESYSNKEKNKNNDKINNICDINLNNLSKISKEINDNKKIKV